jgi:hypothetical protein
MKASFLWLLAVPAVLAMSGCSVSFSSRPALTVSVAERAATETSEASEQEQFGENRYQPERRREDHHILR